MAACQALPQLSRCGARAEARRAARILLVLSRRWHPELKAAFESLIVGQHAHRHAHVLVEEGLRRHLARVDTHGGAARLLEEATPTHEELLLQAVADGEVTSRRSLLASGCGSTATQGRGVNVF